jgi:hypothetical protein
MVYNEKRWLEFRSHFLRVYRQPSVLVAPGDRKSVLKVIFPTRKNLAGKMKVANAKGTFYLPASEFDTTLAPTDWNIIANNPFRSREIGVGAFNWWGATEISKTLATPQKEVGKYK